MAWCDTCKNSVPQDNALNAALADVDADENLSDEQKTELKEAINTSFEELTSAYVEVRYCTVRKAFVVRGDRPTQIAEMDKECGDYAAAE